LARAKHPQLVITDVLMPGMDGFELARQLRTDSSTEQTRVVFYTGAYSEGEVERLSRGCGVNHVISKGSDPKSIVGIIESALGMSPRLQEVPKSEEFHEEHERVLAKKLLEKVTMLQAIAGELSTMLALGQRLAIEQNPYRLLGDFCHESRRIAG